MAKGPALLTAIFMASMSSSSSQNLATKYGQQNARNGDEFAAICSSYCVEDLGDGRTRNVNFARGRNFRDTVCSECSDELWEENRCRLRLDSFRQGLYDRHNELRAAHGAGSLRRDSDAEQTAQAWADNLKRQFESRERFPSGRAIHGGTRKRSGSGSWAQSVFRTSGRAHASDAADGWYAEEKYFSQSIGYGREPSRFQLDNFDELSKWGHFAELVKKGHTKIGCGRALYFKRSSFDKLPKGTIVVCHYGDSSNSNYAESIPRQLRRPQRNGPRDGKSNLECDAPGLPSGGRFKREESEGKCECAEGCTCVIGFDAAGAEVRRCRNCPNAEDNN